MLSPTDLQVLIDVRTEIKESNRLLKELIYKQDEIINVLISIYETKNTS